MQIPTIMPGMRCTISVCNNSRIKNVEKPGKHISFYRFPKDTEIRQIWIQKCKRDGKWNWENCRVCSEHFTPDDYESDLQAKLLGLSPKKKLKATVLLCGKEDFTGPQEKFVDRAYDEVQIQHTKRGGVNQHKRIK
ncbi:hypothetical protein NQ317_019269 [Molorchus minor]|uniref:THAP-type domain-containing protein n=1 Tax=Molorchus minor TaxID=1323400 RepID=A0ABQ9JWC0_9CUCU|nr:hypothetical protein NQ317_019269 [Molorchus minor]